MASGTGPPACSGGQRPIPGLPALSFSARHYYPSEWTVQLGELTSRPTPWNLRAYSNRYKVQDIIVNPDTLGVLHNDIALLKLASSVAYNVYIQPICVESSTFTFVHRPDCWVTGWGLISPSGSEAGDSPGGAMGIWGGHYPLSLFPLHKHSSPSLVWGCNCSPPALILSSPAFLLSVPPARAGTKLPVHPASRDWGGQQDSVRGRPACPGSEGVRGSSGGPGDRNLRQRFLKIETTHKHKMFKCSVLKYTIQ